MIDSIINKINKYKIKISNSCRGVLKKSSYATQDIYGIGKDRIEIERLKIELRKYYSQLGLYVAKQYLIKGYSDFSVDEKFIFINNKIKKQSLRLKELTNK